MTDALWRHGVSFFFSAEAEPMHRTEPARCVMRYSWLLTGAPASPSVLQEREACRTMLKAESEKRALEVRAGRKAATQGHFYCPPVLALT